PADGERDDRTVVQRPDRGDGIALEPHVHDGQLERRPDGDRDGRRRPIGDGNVAYIIVTAPATGPDPPYNNLNAAAVSVTNNDNDIAGITVNPTAGLTTTEAGGTATFTVVLNTQPLANVTVGLSSNDLTEGTVSPSSVTFTTANWNVAQTVTV